MRSSSTPMRRLLPALLLALVALSCSVRDDVALPGDDTAQQADPEPRPSPTTEPQILEGVPEGQTPTPIPTPRPLATPIPDPEGRAELPEDLAIEEGFRLVVQEGGQLHTMLPTGENIIPLTNPDEGRVNRFPAWSPDGSRIGWVATDAQTTDSLVRAAAFEGSQWFEFATAVPAFYLLWDPTSTQLATLSVGDTGIDLGVIDVARGLDQRIVDSGSPFWFDWSPDADGFLVHASGLRLDLVPLDGPSQVLEEVPGAFQAPAWLNTDQPLVYADRVDDEQFLVVANPLLGGRRALITYDGYLQFAANEANGLIALQVIDESLAPVPEVITASQQTRQQPDDFEDLVDPVPRDQLFLMQVFGGEPFRLESVPATAFWWSPDGSRLAYLLEVDPGDANCASGEATYDLMIWSSVEGDFHFGPQVRPSAEFACNYMPFFDQGSHGISYWAPDGSQFVFAGELVSTGESGIWVAEPDGFDVDMTLIGEGDYASFAPVTLVDPAAAVI